MKRRDILAIWLGPLGLVLIIGLGTHWPGNADLHSSATWIDFSKNPIQKLSRSAGRSPTRRLQAVRSILRSKDFRNQQETAAVLAGMKGTPDVELFMQALTDSDATVRTNAAWSLGQIKDLRAVQPLIVALTDHSPEVRIHAARALGALKAAQALVPLIRALEDENWHVRHEVALALIALEDPHAAEPLAHALDGEEHKLQAEIAQTLHELGEPSGRGSARDTDGDGTADSDDDGTDGGPLDRLMQDLDSPDWKVRNNAVLALGQDRTGKAWEALEQVLLNDENSTVRGSAAWALGELGGREAIESLHVALGDEEAEVRNKAITALAKLGDAQAASDIADILGADPDDYVRSNAAWALGILKNPQAFDALVNALDDGVPTVRGNVAWALGELGDARAVEYLRQMLADESNSYVRDQIIDALKKLKAYSEGDN